MKQNFVILAYLLGSLIIIAFFAKSLDFLVNRAEPDTRAETPIVDVYLDSFGELKYASGTCSVNSECTFAGCSSELCTSGGDVVSTCELKQDHPAETGYKCGCVDYQCAWFK